MNQQNNTTITEEWLQIGEYYLAKGFSLIPIGPDKHPLIPWKEYQGKQPTVQEIEEWVSMDSFRGFATVTGPISKVFVLDIDQGADTTQMDIPNTVSVKTGGNGQHYYFRYPEGLTIGNRTGLHYKVDIRGEGGCAILPPALHPSGNRYEWLLDLSTPLSEAPEWLLNELKQTSESPSINWDKEEILNGVAESKRNDTATKVVGKYLSRFLQHEWESVAWPSVKGWNQLNKPPLPEEELRSIFDSIASREREKRTQNPPVKKEATTNNRTLRTSFFEDDEIVAEQLFNPTDTNPHKFSIFRKQTKQVEEKDIISERGLSIEPHILNIIPKHTILFPSSTGELLPENDLDNRILTFIHKWVDIEGFSEKLCLYYIKLTWVYDLMSVVPYLRALGDYGTGKTRLIQTVGHLCYRPMFLAGCTSDAYLFRVIEMFKGTMVINELERVDTDISAQITNILNNGYEKNMGVGRMETVGREMVPTIYDVYCPKMVSSRQPYRDLALESRFITCKMYPNTRKEIPIALDDSFHQEATKIRNHLLAFRFERIWQKKCGPADLAVFPTDKEAFSNLEPRLKQTLLPLLQVIPETDLDTFLQYALEYQTDMVEERGFQLDGVVARSLLELLESTAAVSLKELGGKVNEAMGDDKFKVHPQKLARIIKSWGFKTEVRGHEKLAYLVTNERALKRLKSRFEPLKERPASSATPAIEPEDYSNKDAPTLFCGPLDPPTPKPNFGCGSAGLAELPVGGEGDAN